MNKELLERFKNVDLIRFVLAFMIIVYHTATSEWCKAVLNNFPGFVRGNICVDFFFIIAGFFLFYSSKKENDTIDFAKKKFFRLAPLVWLILVLFMIASIFVDSLHFNFTNNILRFFFLTNIGLFQSDYDCLDITWFVSVLFWVSLFYFYINKIFDKKYMNLIVWMTVFLGYTLYLNIKGAGTGGHTDVYFAIVNIGVLRALAGMGLGYFISLFYKSGFLKNCSKIGQVFISVLEVYLFSFFMHYMIFSNKVPGKSACMLCVMFAVLLYLFLVKQGILSRLFENNLSVILGRYSYAIYLFHWFILVLFNKAFYPAHIAFVLANPAWMVLAIILISVFSSIFVYHFYEKPVYKFLKVRFINKKPD